jgi:hypothetical protein
MSRGFFRMSWNEWCIEVGYATIFCPFGTMPARKVPTALTE